MADVAFLFPGQGSHEVGMGADLLRSDDVVRAWFKQASERAGEDLERLCLRGPEKRLMRAAFIQPVMTMICLGYWRRLVEAGVRAQVVAGHSLGEIAALAAAGVVTPEQAVAMAVERGRFMDDVAERMAGGMAVSALPLAATEAALREFGLTGRVFVANDNAPEQVVVSAAAADLAEFEQRMNAAYPGKCKPLRVSGPWHTPMIEEARARFAAWMTGVTLQPAAIPVLSNATAALEHEPERLRAQVAGQLTARVRWRESMAALRALNVRLLVEVGPRRVLAGLARLNGFGDETAVRGVDSLRAVEPLKADYFEGGGK